MKENFKGAFRVPGAAALFPLRKSHWLFLRALQTPLETFGRKNWRVFYESLYYGNTKERKLASKGR
jgi:hypothetical protein